MQNQQLRRWGETNAPCKGCIERTASPNCHGMNEGGTYRCERYGAFKAEADAQRAKRDEFMRVEDDMFSVHQGGVLENRRRKYRK